MKDKMSENPYHAHVEESIISAHPIELVALLFESLRESIREGRRALAQGEIVARSRALSRSLEILAELAGTVNRDQGGDLAVRLVSLYAFAAERIQQGNFLQSDAPLAEVEMVLQPIAEAWQTLAQDTRTAEWHPNVSQPQSSREPVPVSLCG